jgi:hypothetical protein
MSRPFKVYILGGVSDGEKLVPDMEVSHAEFDEYENAMKVFLEPALVFLPEDLEEASFVEFESTDELISRRLS